MKVVVCPGCQTRLKIAYDSVTRFACPKCKKEMRIASKAPASNQFSSTTPSPPAKPQPVPARPVIQPASAPPSPQRRTATATPQKQPLQTDLFSDQDFGSVQAANPYGAPNISYAAPKKSRTASSGRDPQFETFLKWLGIGLGSFCLLTLLSLPLTFVRGSLLSIIPLLLTFLGMLGLAMAASIWFVVEGFKKSVLDGVLVLFVPYYWIYFLVTNRKRCLRPLTMFGASLVPGILCLIIANFLKPDFAPGSSSRGGFASNPAVPPNLAPGQVFPNSQLESKTRPSPLSGMEPPSMLAPGTPSQAMSAEHRQGIHAILERQAKSGKNELVTARVEVFAVLGNDPNTAAEKCLTDLPGYVPGSFKLALDQKSITYQYRGDRENALSYASVLSADAGIMIRFQATFE